MTDWRNIGFFLCVLSIFPLVCFSATFVPVDNYLIDCGASATTTVGRRNFTADSLSKDLLSTQEDILATNPLTSSSSSDDSPLYQTARIFRGSSKYTFPIKQKGRHWIRLYFFPFTYEKYNLSAANFTVATQDHVLFSSSNMQKDPVMKEYSVNVTSDNLVITFAPSGNSTAFVNAIEVVSVPDDLIVNEFSVLDPSLSLSELVTQALETVWRVNMGGPTVTPVNDTLQRTWIPDQSFLLEADLATYVSNIGAVRYEKRGSTTENTAPATVYGTLAQMNSSFDPRSNFNVTWNFDVSPGFQYLVRFHFCDVISKSLNVLYFDVYVDSKMAAADVDLSLHGNNVLGVPYHKNLVTPLAVSNKLRVSIGPSDLSKDFPNAILNGLEIMKMNNSMGSLITGAGPVAISSGSSSKSIGMIVGVIVGVVAAVVLAGVFFVLCMRRRKLARQRKSKTWVPLSINDGTTSHTMGSDPEENSTNMIGELSPQINNFSQDASASNAQFEGTSLDDLSGVSMSRVFSQLVKSEGR
ncbi:hypothetical protein ACSQ67_010881 [Phaseolus vulgaris]